MTARDKIIETIKGFNWGNYGLDVVEMALVDHPEYQDWVPALADAICAAIDDQPFHVIEFGDGWTLKHPLDCRDTLFECPVNRAAEGLDGPLKPPGRYRCGLDELGRLTVGERVDPS